LSLPILLALALGPGCEDAYEADRAPSILEIRPPSAPVGRTITLVGERFGLRGDRDGVWMAGLELPVESWTDTAVLVRVPQRGPGLADVVIRAGALVSAPHLFEVLPDVESAP